MLIKAILLTSIASLALAQVPGGPWTLPDGTCPGGQSPEQGDEGSGNSECSTDQWPTWCCPGDAENGNGCDAPACVVGGTQTIPITQGGYLTSVYLAAGTTLGAAGTSPAITTGAATSTTTATTKSSKGAAAAVMTAAPVVMAGAWAGLLLV